MHSQLPVTCLHWFLSSSSLVQNPGSHSDFHRNKSGSSFRAKPTWQLFLFKGTTLSLRSREGPGLSTTAGPAPGFTISSYRLDISKPRPWISSTQSPMSLPAVLRVSPGTSYSVHPVQEPYISHRCSSVEDGSSLPLGLQRLYTCLWLQPCHRGVQVLNQPTPECLSQ